MLSAPVAGKRCVPSPGRPGVNPHPLAGIEGEQKAVIEPKSLNRHMVDDHWCVTAILHHPRHRIAIATTVSVRLRGRRNFNAVGWTPSATVARPDSISKTLSLVTQNVEPR